MLSLFLLSLISALTAGVHAQVPTRTTASPSGPVISLFLPDSNAQQLVASQVGSSGGMTTYVLGCPDGTDQNDCGYNIPVTVTAASNSLHLQQTLNGLSASVDCKLQGSTSGVCTESYSSISSSNQGVVTTTLGASDITFFPVTITAGGGSGSGSSSSSVSVTSMASTAGSSSAREASSITPSAPPQSSSPTSAAATAATSKAGSGHNIERVGGVMIGSMALLSWMLVI